MPNTPRSNSYSYAVLMSAHTYWTSVFFARNPCINFKDVMVRASSKLRPWRP
jgi:hypothetical protein